MMKIISHETDLLQLAKTNIRLGWSRFYGVLLLVWASGLIYYFLGDGISVLNNIKWTSFGELSTCLLITGFIILLFISGFILLLAQPKTFSDSEVHTHSLLPRVFSTIRFLAVLLIFIVPFSLLLISDASDPAFRVFGGIILSIFWIAIVFVIVDVFRKYKSYKKFGKSSLLTDRRNYKLGNTVKIRLLNESLEGILLSYYLRNLHEQWDDSGETPSITYKTLHEENKKGYSNEPIEFEIPANDKVKPTKYDYKEPCYWSIEVISQKEGYFSQFIINVGV